MQAHMQAHLPLPRSRTHPGSPSPGEQNGRNSPSLAPDASLRSVSLLTAAHTATDPLGNSLGDRTSLAQGHEANKGQGEEPELGSVFQTLPLPDFTPTPGLCSDCGRSLVSHPPSVLQDLRGSTASSRKPSSKARQLKEETRPALGRGGEAVSFF